MIKLILLSSIVIGLPVLPINNTTNHIDLARETTKIKPKPIHAEVETTLNDLVKQYEIQQMIKRSA